MAVVGNCHGLQEESNVLNTIVIGNIFAFVGAVVMVSIGLIKTKKNILLAQCVQCLIMGIGNLILGGVTGFLSNMVSIVRNLLSIRTKMTVPLKLLFIAIQLAMAGFFNNLGIIGWLPVVAACLFTWYLDSDSEILLKVIIILSEIMWSIFDFTIHNYVALVMDLLTVVTNTIGIVMLKQGKIKTKPTVM